MKQAGHEGTVPYGRTHVRFLELSGSQRQKGKRWAQGLKEGRGATASGGQSASLTRRKEPWTGMVGGGTKSVSVLNAAEVDAKWSTWSILCRVYRTTAYANGFYAKVNKRRFRNL